MAVLDEYILRAARLLSDAADEDVDALCREIMQVFDLDYTNFSSGVSSFGLELIFETIIPVQVTTTTQRYIPIPNAHVR